MKRKSKKDKVREWLMKGRSITQLQAFRRFRILRLAVIIYDLRHDEGIPIITERPEANEGNPYARYHIHPEWLRCRREEEECQ